MSVLSVVGFDESLVEQMPAVQQRGLRGEAFVWLVACAFLGAGAAYAGWLVLPGFGLPIFAGVGIFLMMVNLLRVVHAGGGPGAFPTRKEAKEACRRYRPSIVPASVFVVLAALFAQPGQLPFWPALDAEVEAHRAELIEQHEMAAASLGSDPRYYREELETAGFPVFRLKRIWMQPERALQWTLALCMIVLLPALWSQLVSLDSRRAYEWQRSQRTFRLALAAGLARDRDVRELLSQWSSFEGGSK